MKVLHAAYSADPAPGVARQMAAEQAAADRLGLDWAARYFVPAGTSGEVCVQGRSASGNRVAFKREYYRWLEETAADRDAVLLRYLRYDPFQLAYLRRARQPVFLVHHTLEGPQILQEGGPAASLKLWCDERLVRACHARAAGLIAVTAEIADYEKARGVRTPATFLYPNGIAYDELPEERPIAPEGVPEMLFVASRFVEWHGLDLLVAAARASRAAFVVHVVGRLTEAQETELAADPRFRVHGTLSLEALEPIAARCTLGLGSFALERKDMRQGCTLKVREYLLSGLPVFAGHADVFDPTMRWYRHGACDIEAMLAYAAECAGESRRLVAEEARPWIDKERLLADLHASLRERLAGQAGSRS